MLSNVAKYTYFNRNIIQIGTGSNICLVVSEHKVYIGLLAKEVFML